MKNLLDGMAVLIAVSFVSVCLCGCGDTYYDWDKYRSLKRVVGFVDDSLVMVGSVRCWTKYEESVLALSDEDLGSGCGHTQLCVYNYRQQESSPRWCDSLENISDNSTFTGQMSDSIVWGGNMPKSIKLWKIGESPREMGLKKTLDGCMGEFRISSVKQWLDGKFIARGDRSLNARGDSCQFAILDTASRLLTYKRLDKDLAWIKKCDDVRAWGDDVICSVSGEHSLEGCVLNNNVDTLSVPLVFSKGSFWGNMVELRASICRLDSKMLSCLDTAFTWSEPLKFYRNGEIVVDLE